MSKSNKFNVGDTLLIKNTGNSYSTYSEGARRLGIETIWLSGRWASDHLTNNLSKVKVLSFYYEADDDSYYYGVQDEKGKGWMFGQACLELVERTQANHRECVDYEKGIIQMDSELQALRKEVEDLRAFKQRVLEAVE